MRHDPARKVKSGELQTCGRGVYLTSKWEGEPTESEEMAPRWFKINEIPYDEMWEDDRFWLPKVLSGETVEADFLFNKNQVLLEHEIQVTRPAVDIF